MKAESTTVTYYEHFIEKMIATDMAEWTSKTKEFPEKILDELLVHIKEFLKRNSLDNKADDYNVRFEFERCNSLTFHINDSKGNPANREIAACMFELLLKDPKAHSMLKEIYRSILCHDDYQGFRKYYQEAKEKAQKQLQLEKWLDKEYVIFEKENGIPNQLSMNVKSIHNFNDLEDEMDILGEQWELKRPQYHISYLEANIYSYSRKTIFRKYFLVPTENLAEAIKENPAIELYYRVFEEEIREETQNLNQENRT